jgi:hypothetical protein
MRPDGDRWVADVPVGGEGASLDLIVEAQAPSGYVLGRAGSEDAPITLAPGAGAVDARRVEGGGPGGGADDDGDGGRRRVRRPVHRSWWFWTIIGAVVAGGAATAVVLTLPEEQVPGTLGTRTLP